MTDHHPPLMNPALRSVLASGFLYKTAASAYRSQTPLVAGTTKTNRVTISPLEHGAAQFNAGEFFVAHETWEAAWLEAVGAEKERLQALVQIAAGYAKVESGIRGGALKLLTRGLERLQQSLSANPDALLSTFAAGVSADLERLRRTPEATLSLSSVAPPRLEIRARD